MDVLIKGLEMPKRGDAGRLTIQICSDGSVYVVKSCAIYLEDYSPKWTAKELPPHGDLIDVQEEMRLMQSSDYDTYDDYRRAFDMLDNAPTIIKASERKEE